MLALGGGQRGRSRQDANQQVPHGSPSCHKPKKSATSSPRRLRNNDGRHDLMPSPYQIGRCNTSVYSAGRIRCRPEPSRRRRGRASRQRGAGKPVPNAREKRDILRQNASESSSRLPGVRPISTADLLCPRLRVPSGLEHLE
jgi:hypothetical protein